MEYASTILRDMVTLAEVSDAPVHARKMKEIAEWIDVLEERLEIRSAPNADGETLYLGIGSCDGIGCRDETIKMLDELRKQNGE